MDGISFGELTDADKRSLLAEWRAGTLDYNQFNAKPASVKRMLRRFEVGGRGVKPSTAAPTDSTDDSSDFHQWLAGLRSKRRHIRLMHLSDIHYPYHNPDALSLAYNLVAHVQPEIIIVGSDAFDFQLLSSFGIDPDTANDDDELDLVQRYWLPHIHDLHAAAPDSRIAFIFGNHETRIIRYVINHAPQLRRTIWRRFIEIIRCDGRVDYLGETDRVTVGDVLVQHGNRSGIYPARGLLDDVGYQISTMFGHNHKLTYFSKRGISKTVHGVGGGCLCELEPHYIRVSQLRAKWQLGTVVADIDIGQERATGFYNLEFAPRVDGDGMMTRLGFTTITS